MFLNSFVCWGCFYCIIANAALKTARREFSNGKKSYKKRKKEFTIDNLSWYTLVDIISPQVVAVLASLSPPTLPVSGAR